MGFLVSKTVLKSLYRAGIVLPCKSMEMWVHDKGDRVDER
jgi:hypothetical protein